jgi:hypothetical protein
MKGRSKNSLSSFSNDEKPDKTELKAENRQLAGSLDKMTAAFTALSKGDMPKNSGITPKGPLNTAICRIIDKKFPAVRKAATDRGPADKAKLDKYLSCDFCPIPEYLGNKGDYLDHLERLCDDLITRMGPQNAQWTPPGMPEHWDLLDEKYQYPLGKNAKTETTNKLAAAGKQKAANDKKAKRERESTAAACTLSPTDEDETSQAFGADWNDDASPPPTASSRKAKHGSGSKLALKKASKNVKRTVEDTDEHDDGYNVATKKAKTGVTRNAAAPADVKDEPAEEDWDSPPQTTHEDVERALMGLFKVQGAPDGVLRAGVKLFKRLHSVNPNFDITKVDFSPGREAPDNNDEIALDNESEPKDDKSKQKNEAITTPGAIEDQSELKDHGSEHKDESVTALDKQAPKSFKDSRQEIKEQPKLMGQKLPLENADSTEGDSTVASESANGATTVNPKDLEKRPSTMGEVLTSTS